MKKICLAILCLWLCSMHLNAQQINIIPEPQAVKVSGEHFTFPAQTTVYAAPDIDQHTVDYLITAMLNFHLIKVQQVNQQKGATIVLNTSPQLTGINAYSLKVIPGSMLISGQDNAAVFYGVQTLLQLIPIEKNNTVLKVPAVEIDDAAQFAYRGLHLDVARHFSDISFIKKYIDLLAYHKFNKFHWHLTDDQGWRIEIKKYPLLTDTGAYRNGTIVGRYPGSSNTEQRYGAYYTQDQIREVIAYAQSRYIEVIPEIELPGHASAAIAAYPFLSCFPEKPTVIEKHPSALSIRQQAAGRIKLVQETWGVFDDVFCAGKETTFEFMQNVLAEVAELFPSSYIHIGGDECPKTHWKACSACQQRMQQEGLADEHELQSYFIRRIERFLSARGKTIIGWDEILEGGLAPNAIVMSWRGLEGGIAAAQMGHQAIMTPGSHLYLDHSQIRDEDSVTIGGFSDLEKVYSYKVIPDALTAEQAGLIWGGQGNVWTEYMTNTAKIEYMVYPRASALSEVLWSKHHDFQNFQKKLKILYMRYNQWNLNAFPAEKLKITVSNKQNPEKTGK